MDIPYVDNRGRYADFHALRMTFITNLSLAGGFPKTAQMLARHSNINLTMNTYTMLGVHDQATAVEALPAIPKKNTADSARPPAKEAAGLFQPDRHAKEEAAVMPKDADHGNVQTDAAAQSAAPGSKTADNGGKDEAPRKTASSDVGGDCGIAEPKSAADGSAERDGGAGPRSAAA